MQKALTFQDVLLVPKKSNIKSRSEVDLTVKVKNFKFNSPIIPANMRDIVGEKILKICDINKNLCFMHRFISFEEQLKLVLKVKKLSSNECLGISLGISAQDRINAKIAYDNGIRIYCIDIAHSWSDDCIDMIKYMKNNFSNILLVAGNVASGKAAKDLWKAGADVIKSSIGGGSICSTRIQTGNGVPTFHAIMDIANAKKECILNDPNRNYYIIADGGIRSPGDCVKALCFADMVMVGNLFAGSIDAPGNVVNINGQDMKEYHGSSTHKTKHVEGYKGVMHLKPEFEIILDEICQGIKSGCSYQGVDNLVDLKNNPEFIEITHSGIIESGAHDINLS